MILLMWLDQIKKAISDRGWCPLNYALLDEDDIKSTRTGSENG